MDADCNEGPGFRRDVHGKTNNLLEFRNIGDHMVCRQHNHHGRGIGLLDEQGRKPDACCGVSSDWFNDEILSRHFRQLLSDERSL